LIKIKVTMCLCGTRTLSENSLCVYVGQGHLVELRRYFQVSNVSMWGQGHLVKIPYVSMSEQGHLVKKSMGWLSDSEAEGGEWVYNWFIIVALSGLLDPSQFRAPFRIDLDRLIPYVSMWDKGT